VLSWRPRAQIAWSLVVVDEGQRLKNRKAQALQALVDLRVSRRLLLSGTPLQNNTAELWTLMNFVEPVRAGRGGG
jgi:SNF2 family DNA or RNA helicase